MIFRKIVYFSVYRQSRIVPRAFAVRHLWGDFRISGADFRCAWGVW